MFGMFKTYEKIQPPVYAIEEVPSDNSHSATIISTRCPDKRPTPKIYPDVETIYDIFNRGLRINGDGNCLGRRKMVNGEAGEYEWFTYKQVDEMRKAFGSGLINLDLVSEVEDIKTIGIYSKNCVEWDVCSLACEAYNFCIIPIYDTLGADTVEHILKQTDMKTVVCGPREILNVLALYPKTNKLGAIIQIGKIEEKTRQMCEENKFKLYSFDEVIESGRKTNRKVNPPKPDNVCCICYTSGTSGVPKGAMLTHRNFVSAVSGALYHDINVNETEVYISYLPLAHVLERAIQLVAFSVGAAIGFSQGDTRKLIDDIKVLRPTAFCGVPRVLNKIHDGIVNNIKKKGAMVEYLFNKGMERKMWCLEHGQPKEDWFYDTLIFDTIRKSVGLDRLKLIVSGSAPLSSEVLMFLRCVFKGMVVEGYGATETAGPCTLPFAVDTTCGHVGSVLPSCEFRLKDVPDMGYLATDRDHEGEFCLARGELTIRGYSISKGYFRNPEITKTAFDEDGFFMTGDIAVMLPNYSIRIVDRKKNFFKLAQGEYVAAEKLEIIYGQSPFISQIFVYGNSFQSYLVAVIIPEKSYVMQWASSDADLKAKSYQEICKSEKFRKALEDDLKRIHEQAELNGIERIRNFTVETEGWSVDNGMLTPTMKLLRRNIEKKYDSNIKEMYGTK